MGFSRPFFALQLAGIMQDTKTGENRMLDVLGRILGHAFLNVTRVLTWTGVALGACVARGNVALGASGLAERDLSIQLPTDDAILRISMQESGFSESWYRSVLREFEATSVGAALESENTADDWQVVSVRIVPCQSLFPRPHRFSGWFCWPEVRFVLQPVVRNLVNAGRNIPYFADDRAIHVLYDFVAQGQGLPSEAIQGLSAAFAANDAFDPTQPGSSPREAQLWLRFLQERDANIRSLIASVAALRDSTVPASAFSGIGMRPEYALAAAAPRKAFVSRLKNFLASLADGSSSRYLPKEVTAFSLPEGRDPALLDEWVFLKFHPVSANRLDRVPIGLVSARDGSSIAPALNFARVSMARDDDGIYPAQTAAAGGPYSTEFAENMILFVPDIRANRDRIADGLKVRVQNTTCASCHKLNKLRFDLHNLSYLQGEPMTVSPRVVRDVAIDLAWLSSYLAVGYK